MENEILKYLSKYIPITNELEEEISRIEFIKCFDNGTVLLEEGNISNECYFIIKGCIRSFYIKDGEKKQRNFIQRNKQLYPQCMVIKFLRSIILSALKIP